MLKLLLWGVFLFLAVCSLADRVLGDERSIEFRRPELAALMWAPQDSPVQFRKTPAAAWRSDGTSIPAEELQWLFESRNLLISQISRAVSLPTLRPLVVVFRVDERAQRPVRMQVTASLDDVPLTQRDSMLNLTLESTRNHIFVTRISPPPLPEWPANIKFDVRTQIAEPTVLHVLNDDKARACTPEKPLQVDRGVTWNIGPSPLSGNGPGRLAAVLRVDQDLAHPDFDWTTEGKLKDGTPLELRATVRNGKIIEYGCPLPEGVEITQVELHRRQYRTERYEQVPIRSDLLQQ